jgi:uncharacterized protein (DUF488 family)
MANRIYTVGHSTRDFDEVLAMLQNNEITHLVDVRSFPLSGKFPQWNQSAIIDALPPDIEYRWIPKLGGRRHSSGGRLERERRMAGQSLPLLRRLHGYR